MEKEQSVGTMDETQILLVPAATVTLKMVLFGRSALNAGLIVNVSVNILASQITNLPKCAGQPDIPVIL